MEAYVFKKGWTIFSTLFILGDFCFPHFKHKWNFIKQPQRHHVNGLPRPFEHPRLKVMRE
jgi:hypothetical protein